MPQDIFERFGPNSGYIDELYQLYRVDPALVGDKWATFFRTHSIDEEPRTNGATNGGVEGKTAATRQRALESVTDDSALQERVHRLIHAYRSLGHLRAKINPISRGIVPLPEAFELDLEFYGLTPQDFGKVFSCAGFAGRERMELGALVKDLEQAYCRSIGFEFVHLFNPEERTWLEERIEQRFVKGHYQLTNAEKTRRLQKIIDAEAFESELHKKYVGHKRFSLQGGETLISMLDTVLEESCVRGVAELVLGMPHRGRLNVLCNTFGKPMEEVFAEFEDQSVFSALGSGDVKYHLGYANTYHSPDNRSLKLSLVPNPSHLEAVNPVVEGVARALQDREYDRHRQSVLPVLLHGDAAFVGQGIVYETINLSNLAGYTTGGTVHIVVNNQIGFTTTTDEARSSVYCTDFAKAVQAPILHVNGDDVDAACWAVKLAIEFRTRFQRDVVLDLYCYRKYGHNEGDDPSFTSPVTYREINEKRNPAEIYSERLINDGVVTAVQVAEYQESFKGRFRQAVERSSKRKGFGDACPVHGRFITPVRQTGVGIEKLRAIAQSLITFPDSFTVHPKLKLILEKRVESLEEGKGIDWGFAEALSFGSLMLDGTSIRLSGQDVGRGTFSHRHLVLNDYETGEHFSPLSNLPELAKGVVFEAYNSSLSEAAVVGYEFGYSSIAQNTLVLWEAQFGDFSNGAQIPIDQFVASSEQKWDQKSGLVFLLPHGYEGQGPEHSSARLERFLQLSADGNWCVAYPTTAAQYFHLLRRRGLMEMKRPLVVMTPKSLLRHAGAASEAAELTSGSFAPILEASFPREGEAESLILLSGKIYYDLREILKTNEKVSVKVIRIEELYPFPEAEIAKATAGINPKKICWVQEEPQNMGAWSFVAPRLREMFDREVEYFGRVESASTATGSSRAHAKEQSAIFARLLSALE